FWALLEQSQPADEIFMMNYAVKKLELHSEHPTRDKPYEYPFKELIPALAARVDLTFESNRDEAVLLEALLVANSMRTVYSVPRHRQYLHGGYPSEPFLAEAAARVMFKKCRTKAIESDENVKRPEDIVDKTIATYKADIPSAVSAWSENGLINKEHSGELVARMLCTLAHDVAILKNISFETLNDEVSFSEMISVVDFLRALISEEFIEKVLKARPGNMSGVTLEEAFKDCFVHFTQFVKAGDILTITDEAAYLLFVRGAASQGYGDMDQTDILIPVWIRSNENPDRWGMTAIFIQVKNTVDKIDAQQTFKFFSQSKTQGYRARPYITLAMEFGVLASQQKSTQKPNPTIERTSKPRSAQEPKTKGKEEMTRTNVPATSQSVYPRYEISIAGSSKRVYNVVGEGSYSSLLAHTDMLAEHPRPGKYLDASRCMKPYWMANSSYHWGRMMNGSRLGAPDHDAEDVVSDGAGDYDEVYEGVTVHEYSPEDDNATIA
ncbi:hypothetical protein C0992_005894, partial [Termitomyces sp. T32_za158]